jgi:hypothetical protein
VGDVFTGGDVDSYGSSDGGEFPGITLLFFLEFL